MKKLVLAFLIAVAFFVCGPLPQDVESNVGITAPDGFSVACDTFYSRAVPHFCSRSAPNGFAVTSDGTCRSVSAATIGVPTTSRLLLIKSSFDIRSGNAVGQKGITIQWYQDVSCSTTYDSYSLFTTEYVATALNTSIQSASFQYIIPMISGVVYYKATLVGTMGANAGVLNSVVGYYD